MLIRIGILTLFLAITSASLQGDALAEVDAEYHKTVILFKILQFVTFSSAHEDSLDLVCFGEDRMTRSIASLSKNYVVSGKKIRVTGVKSLDDLRRLSPIQVLFIAGREIDKLGEIREEVRKRSILLIGDEEGCLKKGVHINLVLYKGRVQFEINRSEVEKTSLYLSSKLYKLARIIE